MRRLYLIFLCISVFCSSIVFGQTNIGSERQKIKPFIVQFGVFAQHVFPRSIPDNHIGLYSYLTTTSRSYIIDKGFEFYLGYKIAERFDVFTGARLSFNLLEDNKDMDRRDYDLHYKRIYLPIKVRYHLAKSSLLFDCAELELAWSKLLSPEFGWNSYSMVDAGWHENKLDYLNNKNPFAILIGIGKSFTFNKVTLIMTPYFQYDLNRNQILKGFYHPSTLGVKIIGECKL